MIPEERLSTEPFLGRWINPWTRRDNISRHWGPVALQDPSQGLLVKIWQCRAEMGGVDLLLSSQGVVEYVWYTHADPIEQVSLAFDQNGRPVVAFVDNQDKAWLRWFDPVPNEIVTVEITSYATTPRVTLDDARPFAGAFNDVILGYVRGGILRYRQQRDRFTVEITPPIGPGGDPAPATGLKHITMNSRLRLQFVTADAGEQPWTLAELILDLCARVEIDSDLIDVSDHYETYVLGYRISSEQSPADIIIQLQGVYHFDVCEYDGRLHFPGRGHEPVATITVDEVVERDGDAISITEVQEVELLRRLTFNYVDMSKGFGTNSAPAERRAATVNAQAEQSTEAPISMYPAEAKQTVEKAINVQWAERKRFEFNLPRRFAFVSTGDVVLLIDKRGDTHRIRMVKMIDQLEMFECEAIEEAPWAYINDWTAPTSPSGVPGGGEIGVPTEADFIVMNLPSWDGSDEIGFYIAAHDTPSAGCDVQIMADGALPITDVGDLADRATVGILTEPLLAEVSSEYLSNQTIKIALQGDAEGLTELDYDQLLQYEHLAALEHTDGSWEILQFEDGTLNPDGTYSLTGNVRGRFNTEPKASAAGSRLVLLDGAVEFAQVAPYHKDLPLQVRAIAKNSLKDGAWGWETPTLSPWAVQTEWAPVFVTSERDGSDSVTVSWIPRPRLDVETAPRQSQYFTGYRLTWSDSVVEDVGDVAQHTRASVPSGATVKVAALNSITGPGPDSEEITT